MSNFNGTKLVFQDLEHTEVERYWVFDFDHTVPEGLADRLDTPVGERCATVVSLDFLKGTDASMDEIVAGVDSIRWPIEWSIKDAKEWMLNFTFKAVI